MTSFRHPVLVQAESMSTQARTKIAAGIATLLLTACGGGGGSTTPEQITPITPVTPVAPITPVTPEAAPVQVSITAQVTDAASVNGASLEGAVVTLSTSATATPVTTTAVLDTSTGTYTLQASIDPATLPTTAPVLLTISKPGYETQVIEVSSSQLKAGIPVTTEAPVALKRLDPVTELAPPEGVALTRIGDNKAPNDEINKYMQTASVGLSKTLQLGSIESLADSAGNLSAYPTMTLSISFRALQSSGCQDDEVRLYQAQTQGSTPTLIQRFAWNTAPKLIDASANGSLTLFQPTISTAGMKLGQGPLWLELKSGLCMFDEYDDFEFVNIHAKFNAATVTP